MNWTVAIFAEQRNFRRQTASEIPRQVIEHAPMMIRKPTSAVSKPPWRNDKNAPEKLSPQNADEIGAVWLNLVECDDLASCRLEKPFDKDMRLTQAIQIVPSKVCVVVYRPEFSWKGGRSRVFGFFSKNGGTTDDTFSVKSTLRERKVKNRQGAVFWPVE